jgi:hypothetical protein
LAWHILHAGKISIGCSAVVLALPSGTDIYTENVHFSNILTPFDFNDVRLGHTTGTRIYNDPKLRFDRDSIRTSRGWRRPKGPPLPIYCQTCEAISASKNFVFGGPYFTCWDNEEICPNCLTFGARLSQGLFDLVGEVAEALTAPEVTYTMLAAIADISRGVVSGSIPSEQIADEIESIYPRLGKAIRKAGQIVVTAAGLGAAAATIAGSYIMWLQYEQQREDAISTQKVLEEVLRDLSHLRVVPDRPQLPDEPDHP